MGMFLRRLHGERDKMVRMKKACLPFSTYRGNITTSSWYL